MIPKSFMISVLWGEGMHYFSGGDDTYEAAVTHAASTVDYVTKIWERNGRKGSKPSVRIWELRETWSQPVITNLNSGETPPASPV